MEKQDGHPGLWLAETFSTSPLKPLNWIQRNLTGSKILTFSTKFVFFRADRQKQDGRPGLWLAETFWTSPLKLLYRIQRNLTRRKISTSSTNSVCCGPIGKQDGRPGQSVKKGGTLYSGARYVALWASCFIHQAKDKNLGRHLWILWGPKVKVILTYSFHTFYAPGLNDRGHIVFVLFVCLSVCCQL